MFWIILLKSGLMTCDCYYKSGDEYLKVADSQNNMFSCGGSTRFYKCSKGSCPAGSFITSYDAEYDNCTNPIEGTILHIFNFNIDTNTWSVGPHPFKFQPYCKNIFFQRVGNIYQMKCYVNKTYRFSTDRKTLFQYEFLTGGSYNKYVDVYGNVPTFYDDITVEWGPNSDEQRDYLKMYKNTNGFIYGSKEILTYYFDNEVDGIWSSVNQYFNGKCNNITVIGDGQYFHVYCFPEDEINDFFEMYQIINKQKLDGAIDVVNRRVDDVIANRSKLRSRII
jgi:hypothetical protein